MLQRFILLPDLQDFFCEIDKVIPMKTKLHFGVCYLDVNK